MAEEASKTEPSTFEERLECYEAGVLLSETVDEMKRGLTQVKRLAEAGEAVQGIEGGASATDIMFEKATEIVGCAESLGSCGLSGPLQERAQELLLAVNVEDGVPIDAPAIEKAVKEFGKFLEEEISLPTEPIDPNAPDEVTPAP